MAIEYKYDYNRELDFLHVYSSEMQKGVRGCISIGKFNVDVGYDDKIVGVEIEEASSILGMSGEVLAILDSANVIITKSGNMLFIGVIVKKGSQNSQIQIPIRAYNKPIMKSAI